MKKPARPSAAISRFSARARSPRANSVCLSSASEGRVGSPQLCPWGRARPAARPLALLLARRSRLELGRALRDQGVAFADEAGTIAPDGDDHLAPLAEGVGHGARVAHRDARAAGAVLDGEGDPPRTPANRAGDDGAGHLVAAPALGLAQ